MALSDHLAAAKLRPLRPLRPLPPPSGVHLPPPLPKPGSTILSPEHLEPLANLLLFAQSIVEGWFAGKHRSLEFGSSAEFVEHKAYIPGDPVSHIDWKVYARSRRLMIRKHRDEKQMTAWLAVDCSASMGYGEGSRGTKARRAARVAAALAYLMQRQGDKFSLTYFDDSMGLHIPPGGTRAHLYQCLTEMERRLQASKGLTAAHTALDRCVPLFKTRGCLVVISDFFTDLDRFFEAIAHFQHRRFDILLLHVMDPDEMSLPDVALARFVDLESGEAIQVDPSEIRNTYRQVMTERIARIETEARNRGIDYHILRTEEPYKQALEAWVLRRQKSRGAASR